MDTQALTDTHRIHNTARRPEPHLDHPRVGTVTGSPDCSGSPDHSTPPPVPHPAIVGLAIGPLGVAGVMWIFVILYVLSAVLALFLRLPAEEPSPATAQQSAAGRDVTPPTEPVSS
ncbi:hypothetical protein [Streptomyces sp. bgisy084]|uniref:hypothetical protein n=1 Tax=Streptomyces sp. bgisy084 TaxID=3413777 RepID=UPI003D72C261